MSRKLLLWQLFVLSGVLVAKSNPTVETDCSLEETRITCDQTLPEQIPPGVTEVYVMNYNHANLAVQNHVFNHSSWWLVKTLDIIVNLRWKWYIIHEFDFVQLNNLTFLGIHTPQLSEIHGLAGLDQLIHLDLSDCEHLHQSWVVNLLMKKGALPNVKSLNLKGLNSYNGHVVGLDVEFVHMLKTKHIERLSLSSTNIQIQDYRLFTETFSLKYLDITNVTTSEVYSIDREMLKAYLAQFFQTIITLKIGYTDRFIKAATVWKDTDYECDLCQNPLILASLEKIYVSKVLRAVSWDNVSIDCSRCPGKLKLLHFRENNIAKLNATFIWPIELELIEVDLSSNGMTYLSPHVLDTQSSLRNLFLSNNSLFKMEILSDFGILLQSFSRLEHFAIAFNELTLIPYQMFANNTRLRVLDIKGNRLEAITFNMSHLVMLQVLELRDNNILYIDGNALVELKLISQMRTANESRYTDVDFRDNPLQCSCKSLDFIMWLEKRSDLSFKYMCTLDGDIVDIDSAAVEKANYLCHRATIIYISSSLSVVASAALFVIFLICAMAIRMRNQGNKMNVFLRAFQNGHFKKKYLVFISYSSDDGDVVVNSVHNIVNTMLKELTGIQNRVVSLGELDFRPGLPIIGEMMSCISESCVVMFVVSRAFCGSNWCRMEVREAFEREKPIILIFKEEVEMHDLPEYLQTVFQRYSRTKLVQTNGQYELIPGWQRLCESIILLASNQEEQPRADNMEQPVLLETAL